jgi:hypothetical protein
MGKWNFFEKALVNSIEVKSIPACLTIGKTWNLDTVAADQIKKNPLRFLHRKKLICLNFNYLTEKCFNISKR